MGNVTMNATEAEGEDHADDDVVMTGLNNGTELSTGEATTDGSESAGTVSPDAEDTSNIFEQPDFDASEPTMSPSANTSSSAEILILTSSPPTTSPDVSSAPTTRSQRERARLIIRWLLLLMAGLDFVV